MLDIKLLLKRNLLWVIFVASTMMAIATREDPSLFISHGQYGFGKYFLWGLFFSFLAYTIYCSRNENFFKSIKRISSMYWGWQVGIDLYIGLIFPLLIIYLHAGGLLFLFWIIPILINANLFTLLYFALNYDALVSQFIV